MSASVGGMNMKMTGNMTGLKKKEDDKTVQKLHGAMTTKMAGPDGQQIEMQQKIVCDGKYLWVEVRHPQMPAPMVIKQLAGEGMKTGMPPGSDPSAQIEVLKEMFDLKVTGEDTVDGVKCHVLEGTFKETYLEENPKAKKAVSMMHKTRVYVGQKDSFLRKLTAEDKEGNQTMSTELTNVQLNVKVDESLFRYTPPADARVQDNTGE